jgi:peroxiredoxin
MRIINGLILALIFSVLAEHSSSGQSALKTGIWRGVLTRDGQQLPLLLDIAKNSDGRTYSVHAINASERLQLDSAYFVGDSLHIPMELFESKIIAKLSGNRLYGKYNRYENDKVVAFLPFDASYGEHYRFFKDGSTATNKNISGEWSTVFTDPLTGDATTGIGTFIQKGTSVEGSFLTPTGDYRFLSGSMNGDSLYLSTFDGSNAKLFKAVVKSDGTLSGALWSGVKAFRTWVAKPDPQAAHSDLAKLTYLKPGFESVDFSFPDVAGRQVSFSDPKFKNKVVVIQILGSWCPNCMDETKFLSPWIKRNRTRGVEIVGLAFEHSDKPEIVTPKLKRMIERYDIDYPILLAGTTAGEATAKALPMLNKVVSYPTSIIVDRKGKVRHIHTGFSGPSTGIYYEQFVEAFNGLIDTLAAEK